MLFVLLKPVAVEPKKAESENTNKVSNCCDYHPSLLPLFPPHHPLFSLLPCSPSSPLPSPAYFLPLIKLWAMISLSYTFIIIELVFRFVLSQYSPQGVERPCPTWFQVNLDPHMGRWGSYKLTW